MDVELDYESRLKYKETSIRMIEDRLLRAHKRGDIVDETNAQRALETMRSDLQKFKWGQAL